MDPATNQPNPGGMAADAIKDVEARLGRPLSLRERVTGELDRPADRRARIDAANWKVPMADTESATSDLDAMLEHAEAELAKERSAKMTTAERRLHDIKRARAEVKAKADADAKHKAYLDSPKIKGAIGELQAAIEAARWNPEVTFDESQALKNALATFTTPGSDEAEAFRMLGDIRAANIVKRDAKRQALSAKLAAMGAEREAIEKMLAELEPPAPPKEDDSNADPELAEIHRKMAEEDRKIEAILNSVRKK
jgi:hypothetical protein